MIIVSAAKYEAEPLIEAFPDLSYLECGVGSLAAAATAGRHYDYLDDQDILYVGSCGIFAEFNAIEVVRGDKIDWYPACEQASLSYSVADTPSLSIQCQPRFSSIPSCQVICVPNVSKKALHRSNRQVENIEAYAFFYPIHNRVRSAQILLAVTNQVGEQAHQQWKKNYKQAAKQIKEVVASIL